MGFFIDAENSLRFFYFHDAVVSNIMLNGDLTRNQIAVLDSDK
ncbi:hypothetical protein SAMN05443549_101914 [Flavobacterium fluvii]|uniref:Uncharacterized protein n=1 Tax=Flavobacterium fluvii TaxID=468056 RepID=A0A1M5FRZ9_9FLAO|nr:hypothetical protein SAMN05443549_101914 [Flavobacterium fluvii]